MNKKYWEDLRKFKNNNLTVTADLLGTNRQQLRQWMEKLEIKRVLYWE